MLSYEILKKRYTLLQEKYKEKDKVVIKKDDEKRKLEKKIKLLYREIGIRDKTIKEKDLIIGWLIDRKDNRL